MFTCIRVLADNGPVRVELSEWNDKLVVVKRLQGISPFYADRLKREAEVVKKLSHHNIVPLLLAEDDLIVYRYCPGPRLADALAQGTLRLRHSIFILRDVLHALDHAHQQGIIHHDVKPGNIIINGRQTFLMDFGFAKDLALNAITEDDILLGTPNYMAPEQFEGERGDLRSDLYSAAAVLYHMLTGKPPYGSQVVRYLAGDTRVTLDPLPPQAEPVRLAIMKALARDPNQRFSRAIDMAGALEKALEPVLAYD